MKLVLATGVALASALTMAGGASAQSDPSWTGFSVGVLGGAVENREDENETVLFDRNLDGTFSETVTTTSGANAFSPGFCPGSANGPSSTRGCDRDKGGAEAALRAGYDYQFGSFVVGAVAEITTATAEDSVTAFSTTPASYTFKRNLQGVAAARLRLGYAVGPALVYATGGYAQGKIDNRFTTSNKVNAFSTTSDDETDADGFQTGGGVEYRLAPNLSVIGEYIYTSLDVEDPFVVRIGRGGATATNPFILPPNTTGTDLVRSGDSFVTHSFRIGMAYRF